MLSSRTDLQGGVDHFQDPQPYANASFLRSWSLILPTMTFYALSVGSAKEAVYIPCK
jgi:hypothetical protein